MKRGLCVIVGLAIALFAGLGLASEEAGAWEISRRLEFPFTGILGEPHSISPDGELLLTWSSDVGICLYRTDDLSPLGCFKPEVKTDFPIWLAVKSITWSPDGRYVLFTTVDDRSWRVDAASGELEFLPTSVVGEYFAFSPDGEYLAVGGGGAIVVTPPGALAEAPVARYEGILAGLVWCEAGLFFGVLAPDRKTFQIWQADPSGARGPTLLRFFLYPLRLLDVSPDGRYAWVGAGLVDLREGGTVQVRKEADLGSLIFSQDGGWWLYSYSKVVRDETLRRVYQLAIRPAGAPEDEEQILFESEKRIVILGWAQTGRVALFLVHRDKPELMILDLTQK